MTDALVAFDTDRIKEYVFGTSSLKEIRGASALLDRLNRQSMPDIVGGELIYANGGGGLFVIPESNAEDVIREVQRCYQQATHSAATITGVSVPLPEHKEELHLELALLRHRLHLAKSESSASDEYPLTHSLLQFCESCGVRYAQQQSDENDLICQSCLRKRQEGQLIRNAPDQSDLWARLIRQLKQQEYPVAGYTRPEDFGALGRLSSPQNYMGIIYADGDGMGRTIETLKTRDEYKKFAEAVDGAIYQSVSDAIAVHLQPEPDRGPTWPFDILLLGGDDLVMVTRAQSAIEVALHIVEQFPKRAKEKWEEPLHLSASVTLAHVNYPINSLIQLAESGLKFAKQQAAVRHRLMDEKLDGGLLNFLVVTSANHLDFKEYYEQALKQETGNETLYRTQRPYATSHMHTLLRQIKELKGEGVSRGKLEQLRGAAFMSRKQGTLEGMMAVLRLRDSRQRKALLALAGDKPAEQVYLPWSRRSKSEWSTPFVDIAELIDYV